MNGKENPSSMEEGKNIPEGSGRDKPGEKDLTGRDRMTWNVISSWGGHVVFVVAGFVLPQMIDRHVGQAALGVWDFSWSLVSYFGIAGLGIGSSVNRYVARFRAVSDVENIRRFVSSVVCIQLCIGFLIALLTGAILLAIPRFFSAKFGTEMETALWVILFLGGGLAVEMAFDAFRGVITGCHRWDVHNMINSASHGVAVMGMLAALSLGGGLRSLAAINFFAIVVTEAVRIYAAHRVCPELRIRFADAGLSHVREMIMFGGKTVIVWLSPLVLLQGSALIVAKFLGPAALAVYSRPMSLLRSAQTFINKFAFVLTPTAGSLQSSGRHDDLRTLLMGATRLSAFLVLPIVVFMVVLAGPILRIWMGPRYDQGLVMAILALGHLLPMSYRPAKTILIGMNLHGRLGLVTLATAIFGMGLGLAAFNTLGWSLARVALLVAVPFTFSEGIIISLYACRELGIPVITYMKEAFRTPLWCVTPFALVLVIIRMTVVENPLLAIGLGCAAGATLLGPMYWRHAIPAEYREKILKRLRLNGRIRCCHAPADQKDVG